MVRLPPLTTDDQSFNNTKSEQSNTRSEAQKERVSTACTYCRYRKVKCDGGKPSCSFCVHMGRTECVYAKVSEEENQHLRRRKRELRARRAAERLRAEQEKRTNSQSPSSSAFDLNSLDLPSSSASSQSVSKRRRSSVPKRSRERSMASSSVTSQTTPNIFSSSAPSQLNQEFPPPELTLSGLPAELTNTFSPNFLGLLAPQSNTNNVATVDSSLNLGVNSYTFPSTSMPINNNTFDVNSSNLGWNFGTLSSSAPAAAAAAAAAAATSSSSSTSMLTNKRQDQEEHHFHQNDQAQNDQKVPMAPPQSIFALAASNDSFLDSITGTSEMTIPNFKGPSSFAIPNLRPTNESVQIKDEMEEININRFRQESPQLSQIEQNDPLFTDIQNQLLQEFNTNSNNNDSTDVLQHDFNSAKRRFSNFSEEAQNIFSHWPTSPFHPSQSKRSSVPIPNEPTSMHELKRFLCTHNNPFTFNPVTPLAMSVPSNERFFFNFAASSSSSSTSS